MSFVDRFDEGCQKQFERGLHFLIGIDFTQKSSIQFVLCPHCRMDSGSLRYRPELLWRSCKLDLCDSLLRKSLRSAGSHKGWLLLQGLVPWRRKIYRRTRQLAGGVYRSRGSHPFRALGGSDLYRQIRNEWRHCGSSSKIHIRRNSRISR